MVIKTIFERCQFSLLIYMNSESVEDVMLYEHQALAVLCVALLLRSSWLHYTITAIFTLRC